MLVGLKLALHMCELFPNYTCIQYVYNENLIQVINLLLSTGTVGNVMSLAHWKL